MVDTGTPDSNTDYYTELSALRFNTADLSKKANNKLMRHLGDIEQLNLSRLTRETKQLSRNMPCESTGSIFVRSDTTRMDLMRALISGTVDTPYAHGLYLFDIACPATYPDSPPKVLISTTGNGTTRFNPNLYANGLVCLSLINTWDGNPDEMWNPSQSTIFQVLLSIQVLVMDSLIVQKEPGYEHLHRDCAENLIYSNIVKYSNVRYAMIGMIRNPPEEFKEVI